MQKSSRGSEAELGAFAGPVSASRRASAQKPRNVAEASAAEDVEMEYDLSAYKLLHRVCLEWPCLSLDWCRVPSGTSDQDEFWLVLGSQARSSRGNGLYVVHLSNLSEMLEDDTSGESTSDDLDWPDKGPSKRDDKSPHVERLPRLSSVKIPRHECTNRVRCLPQGPHIVACWGDHTGVSVFDLSEALNLLPPNAKNARPVRKECPLEPVFRFRVGVPEGFALDWSTLEPGLLATGDSCGQIAFIQNDGSAWLANHRSGRTAFTAHAASVEDLQWSPADPHVLASCSCDHSIRVWDLRDAKLASLALAEAHPSDVNAIAWNRTFTSQLISGDDDGLIKVWDLRMTRAPHDPAPIASLDYHRGPIYSLEWNRVESSMFCASSGDHTVSVWDLSLEPLFEEGFIRQNPNSEDEPHDQWIDDIPPQLLFAHEGIRSAKEAHWIEMNTRRDLLAAVGEDGLHVFLPENIYATEN
ncbi:Glutamate-rich wd repeat-containing protein [Cyanidiococcus yangmingshanensis]|uniref:Glutamate-rich WD repeat-containing protein 1 n=1 Tax=Cyanidiococcus yangmingshanensis TaxID=2690220 RepID=A0A7J7IDW6_9RHOD|nr:Glutamate-rich wd repeat-containing protein [Cyanidiococcus yangmingshanensis]